MNFFAFVSYADDGDIGVFRLDGQSGQLTPLERYPAAERVMPFALRAKKSSFVAATRGSHRSLLTFSIDRHTGKLTQTRRTGVEASNVYLESDNSGSLLFGSSYSEHRLTVYATSDSDEDRPVQIIEGIAHAHGTAVSNDDRFVYVSAHGSDQIIGYEIRRDNAQTHLSKIDSVDLDHGFGPRHLRLSPSGHHLYVLSEFRGDIAVFKRDLEKGTLEFCGVSPRAKAYAGLQPGLSRPPADAPNQPDPAVLAKSIWNADLQIHPTGRFLYASDRNTSRIVVHHVSKDGSTVVDTDWTETERQPRGFKIDPSGTFLVACGELSSHVSAYQIEPRTGALTHVSRTAGGRGANWIEIVAQYPD
ncbi:3-carboxymuconate cyclase-like protein [Caballeronia temeraria]|uniref:3-carboxymuconate cyclase-like protein n=1 Tax=Caballeronia temeraria TaxID=1777137 RepID=A0A158CJ65_9BURK|nr:beta-propeller fold lactonase family protein [Caballeronia temeraria]SAK82403.1 3-carboxymuconate cyclase-like protein [Caballeronia temeraria]